MYVRNHMAVPALAWYFLMRMGWGTGRRPTSVPCWRNLRISDSSVKPLRTTTTIRLKLFIFFYHHLWMFSELSSLAWPTWDHLGLHVSHELKWVWPLCSTVCWQFLPGVHMWWWVQKTNGEHWGLFLSTISAWINNQSKCLLQPRFYTTLHKFSIVANPNICCY